LTPSRSSSRTGLRRNSAALAGAPLLLLLSRTAAAQTLDLSVSTRADIVMASLSYSWARPTELFTTLHAGLESRVTFTVRLYETRRGIVPLPGDHLVLERSVARTAYWDFLDETFVVEGEDGRRAAYATPDALLSGFFSLDAVPLYAIPRPGNRRMYVIARARFEPVRLMPPLTLVVLAGAVATSTTPWTRKEAP
jgi:hypothetical protein